MTALRIATRASQLALTQARWVAARLAGVHPGLETTIIEVTTTGDTDRVSPVTTLTEVGAFVRAVQQAVLDGVADLAVHSCKDLPVAGPDGLIQVLPERASPWDVLCGWNPASLPAGARVGTGSPRRAAQLGALRPDLRIEGIRGNIDTRLEKVGAGEYDAVVLAEAGLERIGRGDAITHRFGIDEMVPAPAQGALAVEARAGTPSADLAAAIDHAATRRAVEAERWLLAATGAGCRAALGTLAVTDGEDIVISGFVEDGAGARRAQARGRDPVGTATVLGRRLGL